VLRLLLQRQDSHVGVELYHAVTLPHMVVEHRHPLYSAPVPHKQFLARSPQKYCRQE
jgi:hypothetical protein